jgi:YVTN family beta-propeller protein
VGEALVYRNHAKVWHAAGLAWCVVLLTGCPLASALPSVYVANNGGNSVSQYSLAANGALTPKSPATVATGASPSDVTISVDGKYAYVVNQGANTVSQYLVSATGTLSAMAAPPVATAGGATSSVLSIDGKSFYVTSQNGQAVSQYTVTANGSLSPKVPATVATNGFAFAIALNPDGKTAYVTNFNTNTVAQYAVGATGALTPKVPFTVATGDTPLGIALSPDGKSAYVTNNNANTVSQYTVGATGLLSPKTPSTVGTEGTPRGVTVSPSGNNVYVTNANGNSVSQFTVTAGGALLPMSPASVATGGGPYALTMSADGKSAYTADRNGSTVTQFNVAANGALSPKSPATIVPGPNPLAVAFATPPLLVGLSPTGVASSATGNRIYVANAGSNSVSAIDTATNAVVATVPVGDYPIAVATSTDAGPPQVYVANYQSGSVTVIDGTTNTVVKTIDVAHETPDTFPAGIVAMKDGSVAVAMSGTGQVRILTPRTGDGVARVLVDGGAPSGLAAIPPAGGLVPGYLLVSNSSLGTLDVYADADTLVSSTALPVGSRPAYVTLIGTTAYVALPGAGKVAVLKSVSSETPVLSLLTVGKAPYGIAAAPLLKEVIVPNSGDRTASVISTTAALASVAKTVGVGTLPDGVAVAKNAAGSTSAYIANQGANSLSVVPLSGVFPAFVPPPV